MLIFWEELTFNMALRTSPGECTLLTNTQNQHNKLSFNIIIVTTPNKNIHRDQLLMPRNLNYITQYSLSKMELVWQSGFLCQCN